MHDILQGRLMKLLAVARQGIGGEAINAQNALDAALRKHGLKIDDLTGDKRAMQGFRWGDKLEKRLLMQVIATVCGSSAKVYTSRAMRQTLLANVTAHEKVEIELLWTAHRRQLKAEVEILYGAYLHRHSLFPQDAEDSSAELTPDDEERIRRMAVMMMGLGDVTVRKQIAASGERV
jgi:hypothetical protein